MRHLVILVILGALAFLLAGCSATKQPLRLDDTSRLAVANGALAQDGGALLFVDGGRIAVKEAMLTREVVQYRTMSSDSIWTRPVAEVRAVITTGLKPTIIHRRGFILGAAAGFGLSAFALGGAETQQTATPLFIILGATAGGALAGSYLLEPGTRPGTYVIVPAE